MRKLSSIITVILMFSLALIAVSSSTASVVNNAVQITPSISNSNNVVRTISVGTFPDAIAYDSGNGDIYVANADSSNISVISSLNNTVVSTIEVGSGSFGLAYDSGNGDIYVANSGSGNISVISSLNNTVITTIKGLAYGVAYDPANGDIFAIGSTSGVTVISPSNTVVARVNTGSGSTEAAYDPANGDMYVTDMGSTNLTVISPSNSVITNIKVGESSYYIIYDPANGNMYLPTYPNSVSVISSLNNTVITTINVGGNSSDIAYDSANGDICVANADLNTIPLISPSNKLVATVDSGSYPYYPYNIAYDPGNGYIYATNPAANTVSVIQVSNYTQPTNVVKFAQSGLSSGSWYLNITGEISSGPIEYSSDFSVYLSNGTYSFSSSTADNRFYFGVGNFTVNGASISETVSFSKTTTYPVTFREKSILSYPGTLWHVNLSNGQSFLSTSSSISFQEINGTYSYTVAAENKAYKILPPNQSSGQFTVNGTSVSENVNFVEPTYKVTFTESGLSTGTLWYINLSNGYVFSSTSSSISFIEINGTYSYTISSVNKSYLLNAPSAQLIVNGSPVSKSVIFSLIYNVTFTEVGLPRGSTWYISPSNGISGPYSTSTITFRLVNGSYSFSVSNLSSYYTSNYSISLNVDGKDVSDSVYFYHYAYITGTIAPKDATLLINGHPVFFSSGKFNVSVPQGTYKVEIKLKGYSTYNNHFNLSPGEVLNLTIKLKPADQYWIIGGIAAAAIAIGVIVGITRRRR